MVQRVIEAGDIATVSLSIMRGRALALKPSRVLLTKYERGLTVGPPNDAAIQCATLERALHLLERSDATILETLGG